MKTIYFLPLALLLLGSCGQQKIKTKQNLPFTTQGKDIRVFTTAKDTNLRLTETSRLKFATLVQPEEVETSIFVNPDKQFQEFIGIGGAITDASAEVFARLSKERQDELLSAYYGNDGIGYSLIRTTIHSCDFSSKSYTYINDGDTSLKTFSIAHDTTYRLPLIKKAIEKAGGKMLFYMSPWSPPAFMKSNKCMLRGGKLLPEFYNAWAMYYVKTIKAYQAQGIDVWGITIQNEPMAVQSWESCIYTAEEERDFLKNHLGPIMKNEGLGDKKIVVWDHNRDLMPQRASTVFEDPEAAQYAWGTGFHWYETWRGGKPNFDAVKNVYESYPDKHLLFTEGCNERFDTTKYQYWPNAERYGNAMVNDFNCGTAGWTDWNILLDQTGGPNHVGNFCFAPIHADTRVDSIIYTPAYYYIGHFSKFIRPGARRVSTVSSLSFIESTSFLNTDGSMVTVVLNVTGKAIKYNLLAGSKLVQLQIPAHAMQTIVY